MIIFVPIIWIRVITVSRWLCKALYFYTSSSWPFEEQLRWNRCQASWSDNIQSNVILIASGHIDQSRLIILTETNQPIMGHSIFKMCAYTGMGFSKDFNTLDDISTDSIELGDGQKTILSSREWPRGENYPKNLKYFRNWRGNSVRKYSSSTKVFHRHALACLLLARLDNVGRGSFELGYVGRNTNFPKALCETKINC